MNSAATATPPSTAAFRLSEADIGVLSRVNRFQYLTAHQLTRLAFPAYRDGDRYARRRLHRLTEAGLLLRLRALPLPRFGSAPQVFTLARPGYTLLSGLGIPTPAYFRPAEEHRKAENFPFMRHTLSVVDTLITIERACQSLGFPTPDLLTERELKREPVRVRVPPANPEAGTARVVPVIPDAWVQIADGASSPSCVALELDRATEWQQQWRGKVAALAEWARGPYQAAFGATNLTIAVVVPTEERADALVTWTQAELDSRGLGDLLQLFLFSAAAPNTTDPAHWLCGGHWISGTGERVALLPAPQPVEQVVLLSPR